MQIHSLSTSPIEALASWQGEALAVGVFSGDAGQAVRLALAERFGAGLGQRLEQRRFKAKAGECLSFERLEGAPALLILVGLGEPETFDLLALRQAAATVTRAAAQVRELGLALPLEGQDPATAAAVISEAVRLSLFSDQRFTSDGEPTARLESLTMIGLPEPAAAAAQATNAICAGVELARELVAAPPNRATPEHLAATARELAGEHNLPLQELDAAACEALGMGAFLAVGQGSDLPPRFIHLTIPPLGEVERRVALVGKGITFDSGGYNLKLAGGQIEMMKFDMGGSAAVLGAARALAELRPQGLEVHVLVASCENMFRGHAVHPGDIVTAANGKTIEINNTDAEGRLTLADALVYASRLEVDTIVDLATLTGACVIALGDEIAGLWTNSDTLADALIEAGRLGGESLWRMPLRKSYKEGLKSQYADLKNTGPRSGGSITAALFLQDFVNPDIHWAHLDIAGTVWSDKGRGCDPAGATGFGVRTLVNWLRQGGAS
ncbi:MAG: leucyl aminopeptidase [Cyanobacteriota bacterium]